MARISDSIVQGLMRPTWGFSDLAEPLGMLMGGARAEREKQQRLSELMQKGSGVTSREQGMGLMQLARTPQEMEALMQGMQAGQSLEQLDVATRARQKAALEASGIAIQEQAMRSADENRKRKAVEHALASGNRQQAVLLRSATPEEVATYMESVMYPKEKTDAGAVQAAGELYKDAEGNYFRSLIYRDGSVAIRAEDGSNRQPVGKLERAGGALGQTAAEKFQSNILEATERQFNEFKVTSAVNIPEARSAINNIDDLIRLSDSIPTSGGIPTEITNRIQRATGTRPENVAQLDNALGQLMLQSLKPLLGGAFTAAEFAYLEQNMPNINDSTEVRRAKLGNMRRVAQSVYDKSIAVSQANSFADYMATQQQVQGSPFGPQGEQRMVNWNDLPSGYGDNK